MKIEGKWLDINESYLLLIWLLINLNLKFNNIFEQ